MLPARIPIGAPAAGSDEQVSVGRNFIRLVMDRPVSDHSLIGDVRATERLDKIHPFICFYARGKA